MIIVTVLKLQDNTIARIVIGSTFDVLDFIAYSSGALLLLIKVMIFSRKNEIFT